MTSRYGQTHTITVLLIPGLVLAAVKGIDVTERACHLLGKQGLTSPGCPCVISPFLNGTQTTNACPAGHRCSSSARLALAGTFPAARNLPDVLQGSTVGLCMPCMIGKLIRHWMALSNLRPNPSLKSAAHLQRMAGTSFSAAAKSGYVHNVSFKTHE
jgi:hypothetical protein